MKAITRDHTDNATIERYGDGVAVLDMDGHLRELKYSVPLSPRVTRRASWSGVVDGMGNVQHPIGFLDGEERPDRNLPKPSNKPKSIHISDAELIADYLELGSKKAVADKYELNVEIMNKRYKKIGFEKLRQTYFEKRDGEVVALWRRGASLAKILKQTKVGYRAAYRILDAAGIRNISRESLKTNDFTNA